MPSLCLCGWLVVVGWVWVAVRLVPVGFSHAPNALPRLAGLACETVRSCRGRLGACPLC